MVGARPSSRMEPILGRPDEMPSGLNVFVVLIEVMLAVSLPFSTASSSRGSSSRSETSMPLSGGACLLLSLRRRIMTGPTLWSLMLAPDGLRARPILSRAPLDRRRTRLPGLLPMATASAMAVEPANAGEAGVDA